MASPGNQHCANCIGTLSFPMVVLQVLCGAGEACCRFSSNRSSQFARRRRTPAPPARRRASTRRHSAVHSVHRQALDARRTLRTSRTGGLFTNVCRSCATTGVVRRPRGSVVATIRLIHDRRRTNSSVAHVRRRSTGVRPKPVVRPIMNRLPGL